MQRGKPLRIRLADAERARLDAAAKASGLESSTWARQLLLIILAKIALKADGEGPSGEADPPAVKWFVCSRCSLEFAVPLGQEMPLFDSDMLCPSPHCGGECR